MAEVATPPGAPRWSGIAPESWLWEQFDDEYFVFNPASGHTHLLNALGATVLRLLEPAPLTEAELLECLHAEAGPDDGELAQALPMHLQQLAVIGLIERAA